MKRTKHLLEACIKNAIEIKTAKTEIKSLGDHLSKEVKAEMAKDKELAELTKQLKSLLSEISK